MIILQILASVAIFVAALLLIAAAISLVAHIRKPMTFRQRLALAWDDAYVVLTILGVGLLGLAILVATIAVCYFLFAAVSHFIWGQPWDSIYNRLNGH